jgi:hypothetical protein
MQETINFGDLALAVLRDMRVNPGNYPSMAEIAAYCDECDVFGKRQAVAISHGDGVVLRNCSHINAIRNLLTIAEGLPRYRRPSSVEDAALSIVAQHRALSRSA